MPKTSASVSCSLLNDNALIIAVNVPLALIGGVGGLFIMGEYPDIAAALAERFGQSIIVQRCQHEKRRRILGLLPPSLQPSTLDALLDAYAHPDARSAKRSLQKILRSLEGTHDNAAAAMREALDDTLTLLRLGLAAPLPRVKASAARPAPQA